MTSRILVSAMVAFGGLAASIAAPQPALAQSTAQESQELCQNFGWLVGTWNSYSPWGSQSEPTGGTLVFTSGAGGTVVGRIGSLNSYMEENGYTSGMVVFRGFREVRSYGSTGTTRFQSFGGEFLQVDDNVSEWRSESIGVRQNGELYMSPPAISRLSGHGPFRKSAGTATDERCGTVPQQPDEEAPAQVSAAEMLREILDPEDALPPVILNSDTCPDYDLPRESLDDVMQEWDDDIARDREREVRLAIEAARYPLRDMLDSLILALMFEPLPEQRASLREQSEELHDILQRIDDVYSSEAAEPAAGEATRPDGENSSSEAQCESVFEAFMLDIKKNAQPPSFSDSEESGPPPIISVRHDVQGLVPGLFYGETNDEREANLRDLAQKLQTIADDDPSRPELLRSFGLRFDRLEQEYNAARELLHQPDLTEDQRDNYRATFDQLAEQMVEISGAIGVEDRMRLLTPDEFDAVMRGDVYDMIEPWEEAGHTQGRSAEDLAGSRAGKRLQSALDRAFPEGWSYDHEKKLIEPAP